MVGYASLTDKQLEELAKYLVEEVKLRGPFLSLDFVNRRLPVLCLRESLVWLPRDRWSRKRDTVLGYKGSRAGGHRQSRNQCGWIFPRRMICPSATILQEVDWATRARKTQDFIRRFQNNGLSSGDSKFGMHAISLQGLLRPAIPKPSVRNLTRTTEGIGIL